MTNEFENINASNISLKAARTSIVASLATIMSLGSLHFLSPEFDPSWRMVSEYALGQYGWILSLMFIVWAISSWTLAFAIWSQPKTKGGKIGLYFLIAAGVGEAMASIFDITHDTLHGLAGMIGVLSLPIAAMLISISLIRLQNWAASKKWLLWTANLTWVSLVLMIISLIIMAIQFTKAGGNPNVKPTTLPSGVIGLVGWSNRLLIIAYCLWVMVVSMQTILFRKGINKNL